METILKDRGIKKATSSVRFFQGVNPWILLVLLVSNVLFQLSVGGSQIFKYVGICVILAMLVFLDKEDYIYFSVSLMSVISFATIFTVSVINVITVVYFVRAYIYDNKYVSEKNKRRFPSRIVVVCVVWILYCVNHMFEGMSGLKAVIFVVKQLIFLVYLVDVFRVCESRAEARKKLFLMEVYYVVGVILSSIISVILNGSQSLDDTRMTLNSATGVNRFGVLLAFSMIFILIELLDVKNIKEWIVLAVAAVIILYLCFATKSRNCIITVVLSFAATVFYGIIKNKSRLSSIMLLTSLSCIIIFIFTLGKNTSFYDNIMGTIHRFVDPSNGDITNGRVDIWIEYMGSFLTDTRLFFLGSSNRENYVDIEAHNIFIEILARYGVIGFVIVTIVYIMFFLEIAKSIKRFGKSKFDLISLLPFSMVFFMGIASSLNLLTTNPTINFCMGTAMIYLYNIGDDNDNSEKEVVVDRKKKKVTYRRLHM